MSTKKHPNLWKRCYPPKFHLRMCFTVCLLFWPSNLKKKKKQSFGHPGTFAYQSSQHPDSEITGHLSLAQISPEKGGSPSC